MERYELDKVVEIIERVFGDAVSFKLMNMLTSELITEYTKQ